MRHFIIYGTSSCSYCRRAEDLLDLHGESYDYIPIDSESHEHTKAWLTEVEGHTTVPQIYLIKPYDEYIGGYTELKEYFEDPPYSPI